MRREEEFHARGACCGGQTVVNDCVGAFAEQNERAIRTLHQQRLPLARGVEFVISHDLKVLKYTVHAHSRDLAVSLHKAAAQVCGAKDERCLVRRRGSEAGLGDSINSFILNLNAVTHAKQHEELFD